MQKIGIIGTGMVGSAYAYALVIQGLVDELVLVDPNFELADAHAQDITHGTNFLPKQPKIYAGTYSDLVDADIICITGGAHQEVGETRLDLVHKNRKVIHMIMNELVKINYSKIILVATNPVDLMAYFIVTDYCYPKHKVIGSGTVLDSARFKHNLATYFGYNSSQVHANIIGEHGDNSVAIISTARIGNRPLIDLIEMHPEQFSIDGVVNCFEEAKNAAYKIISGKGSTYYGIGTTLAKISKAILHDENLILTVSCYLDGAYGISDITLSVPCVINKDGIREIFLNKLWDNELENLQKTADILKTIVTNENKK